MTFRISYSKPLVGLEPKSYPKPNPDRYGKLMEWTKK